MSAPLLRCPPSTEQTEHFEREQTGFCIGYRPEKGRSSSLPPPPPSAPHCSSHPLPTTMHEPPRATPPLLPVLHLALHNLDRPFQLDPLALLPQIVEGGRDKQSDLGRGEEVGEGVVAAAVKGQVGFDW